MTAVMVMVTVVAVVAMVTVAVAARELDPAACAARFDVQRDKIIRTEESREMGARYLAELDVGARAECLRLCCETDACDVFVFEEKSPGSCYLFTCGPPEDFRCKFTAHGNFSSGVLALSRRLAELQDRERLAQHERELASLRNPTSSTASSSPRARTAPPRPPDPPRPAPAAPRAPRPPPPPTPPLPTGRCSRYQFECRRGGECIAVYNACDGVPQCADGSDEAAELGCPAPPAPLAPLAGPGPPAPREPPLTPAPRPPPPPPLTQVQMQDSVEDNAMPALGVPGAPDAGDMWPHRLAQAQHRYNPVSSLGAGESHIFSHKGGLLQEGAFEPAAAAPWPRRAWQPQLGAEGVESGGAGGAGGAGGEGAWGADGFARLEWPAGERREWPAGERRAWPVPRAPAPEIPVYMPAKTMPEMPMVYSSQQQTLRDGPKKGFELMSKSQMAEFPRPQTETAPPAPAAPDDTVDMREEKKPPPVDNTTKKKALKDTVAESSKPQSSSVAVHEQPHGAESAESAAAAALAARERWPHGEHDEHDGLSEHPPAAVLLLVLGTLMTAALGALLACRARAARRRRRAHPRLALDADYLVNGMYL